MGANKIPTTVSFNLPSGEEVIIETGKLATQADGSVVVRQGNTMIFASAVSSRTQREGQSFFPLSVDYQEKFAAAGRIPGNFFKRESRLSDNEILTSRIVDRVLRPLFPDGYMNDTQIIINLISGELETIPDVLAGLAASAALAISDVPFAGPISVVRVARVNGEFIVNAKKSQVAEADLNIILGATMENVMMVEGEAKECSEEDLIAAIKVGHEAIQVQCQAQLDLRELIGKPKREIAAYVENDEIRAEVLEIVKEDILTIAKGAFPKQDRKEGFDKIGKGLIETFTEKHGEEFMAEKQNVDWIYRYFGKFKKSLVRDVLLDHNIRLDGRKPEDIRHIWTETDYLPSAHGSAIFTRGETQALATVTLGSKLDQSMSDSALETYYNSFFLHYNFPAYSVGETKPMRGPGRREVGHANLAQRSLKQVIPSDVPYTIRIVSDIMESNGSSSMATVCAGSMALMDAGIAITSNVSGIAMGLITDGKRFSVLSDILGDEDAIGDMDFKVTGTKNGICACQMDIKIDGLPYEVLIKALSQAREGRLHILSLLDADIESARADLKPHAPRMIKIDVARDFIGAIIGPGGKVIQGIQREHGIVMNIEEIDDKGVVTISGNNKEGVEAAIAIVNAITTVPEVGDTYEGKVVKIEDYGAFVDFLPGKSGLVHISEMSYTRIESLAGVVELGDMMKVQLIGIDERSGKFRLSRKSLMEKPEGYVEKPREERRGGFNDRRGGGRDDRRGGGRDDRRGGGRDDRRGGSDRRDDRKR
jgi:polyribonucleotide nucleotidyltransferase